MSNHQLQADRPFVAHNIRRFSALVILGWLAIVVGLTLGVPTLEQVEAEHAVSQNPTDAPSFRATQRMSEVFEETSSGGAPVMVVLEGQQPLGDDAHEYYDRLIRQLRSDTKHVQHIQNFWGDPLTSAAAESDDGKAAYVQIMVTGKPGDAVANESVQA